MRFARLSRLLGRLAAISCISATMTATSAAFEPFGTVVIDPDFELNGVGFDVDTIAFWEAPDPSNSLMFVTAKGNSLVEVWRYPYVDGELAPLRHSTFGTSRVNGVVVDQETDLLYVSIAGPSSTTSVFTLPDLEFVRNFHKPGVNLRSEPNVALLEEPSGAKKLYVSADDVFYVHDATTGEYLGEFFPEPAVETIVADAYYQALYVPDEKDLRGVFAYRADGSPYTRAHSNNFGQNGVFQRDGEGILIHYCEAHGVDIGCGLIVVSDQLPAASEFEFFDRKTWEHLGTLIVAGVSGTDGIASTQVGTAEYPEGLFTAIHADVTTVGVGWDRIFDATGLRCPESRSIALEESARGESESSLTVVTNTPVTGRAGDLYVACVAAREKADVFGVSGLGLKWRRVRTHCSGQGYSGVEVWTASGFPISRGTVTATLSARPRQAVISVDRYSGVARDEPVGRVLAANTNGVDGACSNGSDALEYSFSFSTTLPEAVVFSALALRPAESSAGTSPIRPVAGDTVYLETFDQRVENPSAVALEKSFGTPRDFTFIAIELLPTHAGPVVDAPNPAGAPPSLLLIPSFPNPFRVGTTIAFGLPRAADARMTIYDVGGRVIRTLIEDTLPAGSGSVFWDGRDERGLVVGSGVYFVHLRAAEENRTEKVVFRR